MDREMTEKQANMYAESIYNSWLEHVEKDKALDEQSLKSYKHYMKHVYESLKICISQLADTDFQ